MGLVVFVIAINTHVFLQITKKGYFCLNGLFMTICRRAPNTLVTFLVASKLYGVKATINVFIFVFVLCFMLIHCNVLYHFVSYCIVLYFIVSYCIVLYHFVSYCIVLYFIVSYCIFLLFSTVLYLIVLYCIVSISPMVSFLPPFNTDICLSLSPLSC